MSNNDTTRMAERILSEDTYFERRTTLDRGEARKAFRDGFDRGWKAATCKESVQRFLKDGETVEQCLVRNRGDIDTLLGLLAKEREKSDIVRPYESPRWRDVADEPPQKAQEVLFVHDGKTVHGAWIGGAFWHNNQRCSATAWLPLPMPPKPCLSGELKYSEEWS